MRYRLNMSYDGTHFSGWQRQANALTIQAAIEKCLFQIFQNPTPILGSGRTDAGVHAHLQVAHFDTTKTLNTEKTRLSLNALLPKSIRIFDLFAVCDTFHARFSATSKIYTYYLTLTDYEDPFTAPYSYRPPQPVNLSRLNEAAKCFLGTHDFTSFANIGTDTQDNIRTIYSIDVLDTPNGVAITFIGNGFLYKMVRNIVSTLLQVAMGKISLSDIDTLLASKDRRVAPPPAPARGLFLTDIIYSEMQAKVGLGINQAGSV